MKFHVYLCNSNLTQITVPLDKLHRVNMPKCYLLCDFASLVWLSLYCDSVYVCRPGNIRPCEWVGGRTVLQPYPRSAVITHLTPLICTYSFGNNDCVYVAYNETSGWVVCLISWTLKCSYILIMMFNFGFNLKTWILPSNLVPYGRSYILLLWCLLIHIICILYILLKNPIEDSCTNPRCQAIKFCTVVPNICGSWVWNLIHVILMVPRVLSWFLDSWKICVCDIIFLIANQKDRGVWEDCNRLLGPQVGTWRNYMVVGFSIGIPDCYSRVANSGILVLSSHVPQMRGKVLVNIMGTDHWEN